MCMCNLNSCWSKVLFKGINCQDSDLLYAMHFNGTAKMRNIGVLELPSQVKFPG